MQKCVTVCTKSPAMASSELDRGRNSCDFLIYKIEWIGQHTFEDCGLTCVEMILRALSSPTIPVSKSGQSTTLAGCYENDIDSGLPSLKDNKPLAAHNSNGCGRQSGTKKRAATTYNSGDSPFYTVERWPDIHAGAWTIDLYLYLISNAPNSVPGCFMSTKFEGFDPEHLRKPFYTEVRNQKQRVEKQFARARQAGATIITSHFSAAALKHFLLRKGVIIVLVHRPVLDAYDKVAAEVNLPLTSTTSTLLDGFNERELRDRVLVRARAALKSDYVVNVQNKETTATSDRATATQRTADLFLYMDPDKRGLHLMDAELLNMARQVPGTDEDLIFIPLPETLRSILQIG